MTEIPKEPLSFGDMHVSASAIIERMSRDDLATRLELALKARVHLLDEDHRAALRLFAGFYEGNPELVADLYACTLVLFDYAPSRRDGVANLQQAQDFYLTKLP